MRAPLALAGLALLAAGLPVPAQAGSAAAECQGKPATIVSHLDTVHGTSGDDVILALARGVHVFARGGDDTICLPDGFARGGRGHDSLEVRGTDVPDKLYVGRVEDLDVALGPGDDVLRLRGVRDGTGSVDLGDGDDKLLLLRQRSIEADLHLDRLVLDGSDPYRLTGAEMVWAAARSTTLVGSDVDERLAAVGTACTIVLRGHGGADRLTIAGDEDGQPYECPGYVRALNGQVGDDVLKGRAQDDTLIGGPGRDAAYGGRGRDECQAETERNCER